MNKNEEPNSPEYLVKVELPKVLSFINDFLKPSNFGFKIAKDIPKNAPAFIYQSEKCQVQFVCFRDRPYASEPLELYISYGRLHASYGKTIMDWNHEKCFCWHSLELSPFLYFLDRLSPSEALQVNHPKVLHQFFEASRTEKWTFSEYQVRKHAIIWNYYGERLFTLFDSRHSKQWEEYIGFVKEYDRIGNEIGNQLIKSFDGVRKPRLYQIC